MYFAQAFCFSRRSAVSARFMMIYEQNVFDLLLKRIDLLVSWDFYVNRLFALIKPRDDTNDSLSPSVAGARSSLLRPFTDAQRSELRSPTF